jgi:membrane protein DedA with SNARE-associated domain/membrane-associated phospholipid phosphatase
MDFFSSFLPTIEHFRLLGYWIILVVCLAESLAFIGMIIPSNVILVFAGFVSSRGSLDLGDAIWFGSLGTILGAEISYYLGSHIDRFFRSGSKLFASAYLEKGKRLLHTHGGKSILVGRFIGLSPVVPFVAGALKMDRKRFFYWNALSAFSWVVTMLLAGFLLGQAWRAFVVWSTRVSLFVVAFMALLVCLSTLNYLVVKKGKQIFAFLMSVGHSVKQAIATNRDVQRLIEQHPYFFGFLRHRLDKSRFSGLSLTLLVVAFIYVLLLFAGIVEDLIVSDPIVAADTRIENLLAAFRSVELTRFFLWITLLGNWQIMAVFATVAVALLWLWERRLYVTPLLVAMVGSTLFNRLGKLVFHRPRPEVAVYAQHSFSFPSGHATTAVVFYGFMVYVLARHTRQWKRQVNLAFAGVTMILLIGFSRLYLGVHYVSDVWGGYLAGLLWLIIAISFAEWLRARKPEAVPAASFLQRNRRVVSLALTVAAGLFYGGFAWNYHPQLIRTLPRQREIVLQQPLDMFVTYQLPKFTESLVGKPLEPLSVIVIAESDQSLIDTFQHAGWSLADRVSLAAFGKLVITALSGSAYPRAPISPSFWNARVHDFGFEKPTAANTVRKRHRVRMWRAPFRTPEGMIYVGSASFDTSIKWLIIHKIAPDLDTERDLISTDLEHTGRLARFQKERFIEPTLGRNFYGDPFFTDGKIDIMWFKTP